MEEKIRNAHKVAKELADETDSEVAVGLQPRLLGDVFSNLS